MLVLPIINRDKVFNVEVTLKDLQLVNDNNILNEYNPSDIIAGGKSFLDSEISEKDMLDFIRFNSIRNLNNFLITTKENNKKDFNTYEVSPALVKINNELDELYKKVILDIRYKDISKNGNGYYLSFDKIGFNNFLSDDKINLLENITNTVKDTSTWDSLFEKVNISDLVKSMDFLDKYFEFTVIPSSIINEGELIKIINSLEKVRSRDYKMLNNYYIIAKGNQDVYKKLSKINKCLTKEPYKLIMSKKQKKLVRVNEDV